MSNIDEIFKDESLEHISTPGDNFIVDHFLASVILEEGYRTVVDHGIGLDFFQGDSFQIWKFIEDFFSQYKNHPSIEVVENSFGSLPRPKESLDYWINQLKKRRLHSRFNDLHIQIGTNLQKGDPYASLEATRDFIKIEDSKSFNKSSLSLIENLECETWQVYSDAKSGKMGIPTPWRSINRWTRGWYQKDMSFIIARSGNYKTWIAICCADAAVSAQHGTLFISCEMTKVDIASRYFALKLKIPYASMRKGDLNHYQELDFKRGLDQYKPEALFEVMDGSQGLSIGDIERAIERTKAKLVIVDSSYRITARQRTTNRFDNMAFVANDLKSYAQVFGKSILATTQVNREGGKKKHDEGMGQEDVALSDVITWNSTNVLGLRRKGDKNQYVEVHPIKIRENENLGQSVMIDMDFKQMQFVESSGDEQSASDISF